MSKSLGNGVDPMDVVEKYGADSLRYFLTTSSSPGQDLRYSDEKIESTWNFINKIWNASRFVIMNLDGMTVHDVDINYGSLNIADQWILDRLNETIKSVDYNADKFEFGEVGRYLYSFVWEDFCSWYIEMAKLPMQSDNEETKAGTKMVLAHVLNSIIKLLHPFMPFVTEEIYQMIGNESGSISTSDWPVVNPKWKNEGATKDFTLIMNLIKAVRNIRAEADAAPSRPIKVTIHATASADVMEANRAYLEKFCNPSELIISTTTGMKEEAMTATLTEGTIYVAMDGLVDKEAEIKRLEAELKKLAGEVKRAEGKLSNEKFTAKAPAELVEEEHAKLADYKAKFEAVEARLAGMK